MDKWTEPLKRNNTISSKYILRENTVLIYCRKCFMNNIYTGFCVENNGIE